MLKSRYTKWDNVQLLTGKGRYYLLQVRYHLKTNKAQFRQRCLGWVNDHRAIEGIKNNLGL